MRKFKIRFDTEVEVDQVDYSGDITMTSLMMNFILILYSSYKNLRRVK